MFIVNPSLIVISGIMGIIVHELGHLFTMVCSGRKISRIEINAFNIDIVDNSRNFSSYESDIIILLSGPIANFAMFVFLKLLFTFTHHNLFNISSYQNLSLCIVNLLPVVSLDGGQILYIVLNKKFSVDKCNMICQVVSCLILIPLAILGFLLLLKSKYNFTLLLVSCYLMVLMVFRENGIY